MNNIVLYYISLREQARAKLIKWTLTKKEAIELN